MLETYPQMNGKNTIGRSVSFEPLQSTTVAICRAAVEQCLEEKLGRQGDGRRYEFKRLVKEASKWHVLDDTTE